MSDYQITEALNLETGQYISAADYFSQSEQVIWHERIRVEQILQQECREVYVCPYCHQPLVFRGHIGGAQTMHFRHKLNSGDCPLKTHIEMTPEEMLARKFHGARESLAHREMKQLIMDSLAADARFSKAKEERNFSLSDELAGRFRPDVQAVYNGTQRVVFEVQLSTTFLSVIVKRDLYYKSQQTFIVWVFKNFSENLSVQRFTEKDILYANRNNVFLVDDETFHRSRAARELMLRCLVLHTTIQQDRLVTAWETSIVKFSELHFDTQDYRVYWKDVNAQYAACHAALQAQRRAEEARQRQAQAERDALQQQLRQQQAEQEAERFREEGDALAEMIKQRHRPYYSRR